MIECETGLGLQAEKERLEWELAAARQKAMQPGLSEEAKAAIAELNGQVDRLKAEVRLLLALPCAVCSMRRRGVQVARGAEEVARLTEERAEAAAEWQARVEEGESRLEAAQKDKNTLQVDPSGSSFTLPFPK